MAGQVFALSVILGAQGEVASENHDHVGVDPHTLQSLANAKIHVATIGVGLTVANPAVVVETIGDRRLLDWTTDETGATVGSTLCSDALSGPDGSAGTYLGRMHHNAASLVAGLKPRT